MELPDVKTIILCCRDYHPVVKWVENSAHKRLCVSNESLEVVRRSVLGIVVPKLKEVVLATCQHEATVKREVSTCNCAFMDTRDISNISSFESTETKDSDFLVFRNYNDLSTVFRELETSNDLVSHVDLVLELNNRRAVDHKIVSLLAYDAEKTFANRNELLTFTSKRLLIAHASVGHHRVRSLRIVLNLTIGGWRERDMNEFRFELQIKNFGGEMLAPCIVQGYATVFTTCNEKITTW